MRIRLLILEPNEDVLESYVAYFVRTTDFNLDSTTNGRECLSKIENFRPDMLMLEPALPGGLARIILSSVEVPVIVLSRFDSDETLRGHPSVCEYYVKPKRLSELVIRVQQIAGCAQTGI